MPGLSISFQSSNILFDLMLQSLLGSVGPGLAQRFAVSLSVLVFGWGALLFIFRVAGRNWWFAAPCVVMLAYGFIFRIGFFNFYLSMGLCLWYLAITWEKTWHLHAMALPLLLLAWVAHPFPAVWTAGIAAYVTLSRVWKGRRSGLLFVLGVGSLLFVRYMLTHRYMHQWSQQQIFYVTGANQLSIFGLRYASYALFLIWLRQLWKLVSRQQRVKILLTVPFQLFLLNATAVWLIPNQITFPQFEREFAYITTRLSLGSALLICAVLAAAPLGKFDKIMLLTVAGFFFAFVYKQERQLNRLEDGVDAVVKTIPAMQRVIWQTPQQSLYWLCFQHDVDRACIGHCFSYGNYEPSSGQFRIRASSNNGIVLSDAVDVDAVRTGNYAVRARDLPMQVIYPCGAELDSVCSHPLSSGDVSGKP